ncbi:MAG: ankyrin repeat domain-containing protein [Gammaproteobacteria bacterium]
MCFIAIAIALSVLAPWAWGMDAGTVDDDGTTPLHMAVYRDDVAQVKKLIAAGADVRVTNAYGSTPMAEAAIVGDVGVIKALLEAGADVESPGADGQTALMVVSRSSNVEAARVLIRHRAKVNAREGWRRQTALMWAAAESQPEMLKELIRSGAQLDARSQTNEWAREVSAEPRIQWRPAGGLTALLYASRQGCLACAELLVEAGADVNLADPKGLTPLIMATTNFNFDVAAYLLRKGANPNKWDYWGRTPLYVAVDLNTLPHGGWPDRPSVDETTPLRLAELLLAASANPNLQLKLVPPYRSVKDDRLLDVVLTTGATPLIRAAKAMDEPMIRLLLAHGALPDLPTVRGITPLMAAAGLGSTAIDTRGYYDTDDVQQRSIESVQLLLAAGADVNHKDVDGQTAMHGAARWGWAQVVPFLAANKAEAYARDSLGLTPLDMALGKGPQSGRGDSTASPQTAAVLEKLVREHPPPRNW